MHRNQSVDVHQFAMAPSADVPRSSFNIQTTHKTTFDGGYLIPIYVDPVLPGDTFNLRMTAFCRISTPIAPIMDNLYIDSFFFFVPLRLLWTNFAKFMGEQTNPGDSISFTLPQLVSPASGFAALSIYDYFGLPTVGQVGGGNTVSVQSLPFRAYNLIWHQWFRDENVQNAPVINMGDGPDVLTDFALLNRGKRHDYFTSALPWPQKGGVSVTLPLGTSAPIKWGPKIGASSATPVGQFVEEGYTGGSAAVFNYAATAGSAGASVGVGNTYNMYADLASATAATINSIRQAFQTQRFLERDARGGTRLQELIWSHFRVRGSDARLQRPEYLGGGSTPVNVSPIAQTSGTGASGTTMGLGTLGAMGTAVAGGHGFTQSFSEHGLVIGLVSVRADLTYQQGIRRFWSYSTRYDFPWPVFSHLGEQAVLNKEIYADGSANDALVFGYQERYAEARYFPAMITGYFRSTTAGTIDYWHLAQKFTSLPTLNATFIQDGTRAVMQRAVIVGGGALGQQFICDTFFNIRAARPLPMYGEPGLIDHF